MGTGVQRRSLAAVLASTLGLGLAYGIGNTVASVRFESWGLPGWVVGLAGAMPSFAVLLLVPVGPAIAARLGAVRAMLTGALVMAATFLLMPVLAEPGWWLALRFLAGAGLALPWLVGETWINTVTTDRYRGRVLAAYTVLIFGGWALGSELVRALTVEGLGIYLVGTGAVVLAAVPLVLGRASAPRLQARGRFALGEAVSLAPLAMAAALVGGVAEFGYISLMPSYAVASGLDLDQALHLLTALVLGSVALQVLLGWLADRVDRRRLLLLISASVAVTAGLATVTISSFAPGLVTAFVLGGSVTGFYSVGLTLLGEQVPVAKLSMANAAFLMSYETGSVVGPLVAGFAMDVWRPHGLAAVMVTTGLVFAVVVALSSRRHRATPATPATPAAPPGGPVPATSSPGQAERVRH